MKVNLDVGEIKGLKTPVLDPKGSSLSKLLPRVYQNIKLESLPLLIYL
jgi:hypothetical protein